MNPSTAVPNALILVNPVRTGMLVCVVYGLTNVLCGLLARRGHPLPWGFIALGLGALIAFGDAFCSPVTPPVLSAPLLWNLAIYTLVLAFAAMGFQTAGSSPTGQTHYTSDGMVKAGNQGQTANIARQRLSEIHKATNGGGNVNAAGAPVTAHPRTAGPQ